MPGKHGGSVVYQLVDPENGTVQLVGWGPASGDPLTPIRNTTEGRPFAEAVKAGRLVLQTIGRPMNRLDAARITQALAPRGTHTCGGVRTGVYHQGGTKYFPTIGAAATYLGMTRQDLAWKLHYLPKVAIFHLL